jgi:hypothetical protein
MMMKMEQDQQMQATAFKLREQEMKEERLRREQEMKEERQRREEERQRREEERQRREEERKDERERREQDRQDTREFYQAMAATLAGVAKTFFESKSKDD